MRNPTIVVLFVNHLEPRCGVYQYFVRLTRAVIQAHDNYHYIETNNEWEFDYWRGKLNPTHIIYNFYVSGATMGWLTNSKIQQVWSEGRKQYSIYHEGNIDDKGFDLVLHQDPTNIDPRFINLPRPIPEYPKSIIRNTIPTFGTFGFGLGGKGYDRVIQQVQKEYITAHIRINIAFAHFGDNDGTGARAWADYCKQLIVNTPGIQLTITHDLLPERELLDFLAQNDVNCFFYDENIGRGIASTLDYALAVFRPIALTRSYQFKHIQDERLFISENNGLKDIIARGVTPLEQYHQEWNTRTLIDTFERIIA